MSKYVDGFVIPIKKTGIKQYVKMARLGKQVWMDHGALDYYECLGNDLKGMPGCLSFIKLANVKQGETVAFSFIIFKSKKHRDQVNAKVMKDPRMQMDPKMKMPFDPKKMAYGGFEVLVNT